MSKDSPRTSVLRDNDLIQKGQDDLIRRGDALALFLAIDDLRHMNVGQATVLFAERRAALIALPAVQPTVSPELLATTNDVIEIDIRAVMMERIEEAASQSPWVPPEYAMNEIISDCCSFLREPRDPSPDVAALLDAAEKVINSYWHSTDGVITGIYDLEAALARVKGETT